MSSRSCTPGLTELDQVGESYHGQPLMLITITNEATGPAHDKPALYVDGGIHAGELTGSAVATHLIGHLLNGYGNDERVTALLDTRAFYVAAEVQPGRLRPALIEDQFLRSTPHPFDEDEDGVADENPPEDLDGDGWITQLRYPDDDGIRGSTRTTTASWCAIPSGRCPGRASRPCARGSTTTVTARSTRTGWAAST